MARGKAGALLATPRLWAALAVSGSAPHVAGMRAYPAIRQSLLLHPGAAWTLAREGKTRPRQLKVSRVRRLADDSGCKGASAQNWAPREPG